LIDQHLHQALVAGELLQRAREVLFSRSEADEIRSLVIAAPVTTQVRGYAVEVKVGKREGLQRECVINCDWLVTLPKEDLVERVGILGSSKLRQLDDALRFALGLEND